MSGMDAGRCPAWTPWCASPRWRRARLGRATPASSCVPTMAGSSRPSVRRSARRHRRLRGRRARVEYHEQQRGSYRNVYLDAVEPVEDQSGDGGPDHSSADAVAWETALEATPWLVGSAEPQRPVDPQELYSRLRPFKEMVADDIRQG